jgi:hypothetical protein
MNDAAFRLLTARRLPARLTVEEAAVLLGFRDHDLPVLLAAKLLRPLGQPAANSIRYFALAEVQERAADPAWLGRATQTVYRHWQGKNARKKAKAPDLPGLAVA